MTRADIVFVGLGAAAMSLAIRLVRDQYPGRVLFIEPHPDRGDDRTWCGWGPGNHPFQSCITRKWPQWGVSAGDQSVVAGHPDTPYEMLRASDVAALAGAAIAERPDWVVLGNRALASAERIDTGWRLLLDNGDEVQTTRVLDARPPALSLQRPWVWQSFVGVELADHDFGQADTVRLMDFVEEAPPIAAFFYELPIARDRRLVEFTQFTPEPADEHAMRARIDTLLAERGWQGARVIRTESGHLPMAPIPPYSKEGWMRIGTAGGSMRPATGYAFHAIQRWADAASRALCTGKPPPTPQRSGLLDWLDGVFLESLWQNPRTAGSQFIRLFRNVPPDALGRFLMSQPRALDIMYVLRALPVRPMLRAAWQHGWRRT